MNYKHLIVKAGNDFIAEIILNRPTKLNTMNIALATELDHALNELELNKDVRVIILKGAGKAFCTGIDVKELFEQTVVERRTWLERVERPVVAISRMSKPVIAQVHGVAAAIGAGLVASSDLCIASEDARIGLTAINVGLSCFGPTVPVTRSVGRKRALELLLFGDFIKAQDALNMGLLNRVVPINDLDEETRAWAVRLAAKSPLAIQMSKKAFYTAADLEYYKALKYMNEAFVHLTATEDAKEGVTAFLEKRKPVWKQR